MNNFYPFFSFPRFRKPNLYYIPHNNVNSINKIRPNYEQNTNFRSNFNNSDHEKTYSKINSFNNLPKDEINDDCFDFFGVKLYSDDLLILFLLFFLYNEDVKDMYLYIALILLLLS